MAKNKKPNWDLIKRQLSAMEVETYKPGRKPLFGVAMTGTERSRKSRGPVKERKIENIAILDFETDPFDGMSDEDIMPFVCVLYAENFEPIIIWEENPKKFLKLVYNAIVNLPDSYTIYAHNGGKFDFLFLVSKLRGNVQFKGRGIMAAKIKGKHGVQELRDSFHIIPERLANWQKDSFDYMKLRKGARHKWRAEIIRYCLSDCKYLLEIVKHAVTTYGLKLSIGQMAMAELKKHYKPKNIGENMDFYLRRFFFGGRVECLEGMGHFRGPFKLIDVNSMYPFVMASVKHPIGNEYNIRSDGSINAHTVFIDLTCRNHGALIGKTEKGETSAEILEGRFFTTIHEYKMARKYKLIEKVQIHHCIDCDELTDFSRFIVPMYAKRQETKALMDKLKREGKTDTFEFKDTKKEDMFLKFLMNNSYGKFAQNPRNYKKYCLTDPGKEPSDYDDYDGEDWGTEPAARNDDYCVWERREGILRFNNVGTAASITGAARAVLLEALQFAVRPIYCDTDSIICADIANVKIHKSELGAWDLEKTYDEIIIAGKKLYAAKVAGKEENSKDRILIRSKGAGKVDNIAKELELRNAGYMASGLIWQDMLGMLKGKSTEIRARGPTLNRNGEQYYLRRNIRATAVKRQNSHPLIARIA